MAKLGKKKKDEADKLEAELNARHAAELVALEAGGGADGGAAVAQAGHTAAPTAKLSAMALDDDAEEVCWWLGAAPALAPRRQTRHRRRRPSSAVCLKEREHAHSARQGAQRPPPTVEQPSLCSLGPQP
jgi:hypothetical protein